jgi:hypothetical protein
MAIKETELVPPLEIGAPAVDLSGATPGATIIDIRAPLSSFHYQVKNVSTPSSIVTNIPDIRTTAMASALLRTTHSQRIQDLHLFLHMGESHVTMDRGYETPRFDSG